MGGFIGTVLALLRNMPRTGVKDSTQIENDLNLPVYATVPRSPIQVDSYEYLEKEKSMLAQKFLDF